MPTEGLELADRGTTQGTRDTGAVPPPLPPDDPEAWYAPDVRSQTEVAPGVVVTIRETDAGFAYDVREPALGEQGSAALERVTDYFADANLDRPRTREGAVERMNEGFDPKYRRVLDRLLDASPALRRRIEYHALADLGCLGRLTPYALDDRIDVADVTDDSVPPRPTCPPTPSTSTASPASASTATLSPSTTSTSPSSSTARTCWVRTRSRRNTPSANPTCCPATRN